MRSPPGATRSFPSVIDTLTPPTVEFGGVWANTDDADVMRHTVLITARKRLWERRDVVTGTGVENVKRRI